MDSFQNILVPTDFSKNSSLAYEFSLNFIKKNSCSLHIMHVIEPVFHNQFSSSLNQTAYERDKLLEAEEDMERFINNCYNAGIQLYRVIKTGKPYEEIIRYTKSNQIDMIIIATHGWTNLSHMLAGNVTKKVLKLSEVPVICIKTNVHQIPERLQQERLAENWVG